MRLIDASCPHCGASLKIDADMSQAVCEHCGAQILIDDEVQHVQYDNAEEAGYKFEKGRQRAQAEAGRQQQHTTYTVQVVPSKPKKRRTWLWVLGWLFVFPIPLTILLLRKKDMKPALKYGIIAAAWIVYLIIGLSGGSKDNDTSAQLQTDVPAVTSAESTESVVQDSISEETQSFELDEAGTIDAFVEAFNSSNDTPLVFNETFVPSDSSNGHYRTEFRLNTWRDAVGKSYSWGDTTVDIVCHGGYGGNRIRIYMYASFEECESMIRTASPILDNEISEDVIQEAIDYINGNVINGRREANGYYYSNLGLLLFERENYCEFMLKMRND